MSNFETKLRFRRLVNDSAFADRKLTGHDWRGHYSITSSARASSVGGISRPSALGVFEPERAPRLLRGGRKRRQFLDVTRVVLDDHGCVKIRRDLLEAFEGRDRLRAIIVEPGHAVGVVILAEWRCIAGDDPGARLRQLDQQAVMPRRVPGR